MRRFLVAIIVATVALTPIEAGATYRWGLDPNDTDGKGDIRIVSLNRYSRAGTRWIRVMVGLHDGSDLVANGRVTWKLDGRGGPATDHMVILGLDLDGGVTGCRLHVTGNGAERGWVAYGDEKVGCRFQVESSRITKLPRFRAATELYSDELVLVGRDRAPNRVGRWFR